jgi:hypothetical protein
VHSVSKSNQHTYCTCVFRRAGGIPTDLCILQNSTLARAFASVDPSTSKHAQRSKAQDVDYFACEPNSADGITSNRCILRKEMVWIMHHIVWITLNFQVARSRLTKHPFQSRQMAPPPTFAAYKGKMYMHGECVRVRLRRSNKADTHTLPRHKEQTYVACGYPSALGVARDSCSLHEEVGRCVVCVCTIEASRQYRQTRTSCHATIRRLTWHAFPLVQLASPEMFAPCTRKWYCV